jgi:hypothetical protein
VSTEDWKVAVAIWGALTGTIGLTIGIISLLRDRSRIRVFVSKFTASQIRDVDEMLRNVSSETFAFVEVINIGRRVRYVYRPELWRATHGHLLVHDEVDFVFTDNKWSTPRHAWENWRVEEGQSVTFVFGFAAKHSIVRIDLPDGLARTRRIYYKPIIGRFRWYYGRWKGGGAWKELRELFIERKRTRHHEED